MFVKQTFLTAPFPAAYTLTELLIKETLRALKLLAQPSISYAAISGVRAIKTESAGVSGRYMMDFQS